MSAVVERLRPGAAARPDGPIPWPVIGNLPRFAAEPLAFMESMAREYGDVAYSKLGPGRIYWLFHPRDIERVLVGDARHYFKDQVTKLLSHVMGEGLVTSEGDHWRRQRKLVAPSMTRRHVEVYAQTMIDLTDEMVDGWSLPEQRDLDEDLMALTLRVVVGTLFGTVLDDDVHRVGELVGTVMRSFERNARGPERLIPSWVPTPGRLRFWRCIRELDGIVFRLIEQRRGAPGGDDLLSRMIEATDDQGSGMSDEQLRDEAMTLFLAGHETTSLAVCYSLMRLARHPEVAARLTRELDEVVGEGPLRPEHFRSLRYTDAVVREAMRLHPPVYAVGREAQVDCEVAGWRIPKGSTVLASQWVVHRDPRWYPEPLRFWPERWLGGAPGCPGLVDPLPRLAYFPYGGGPRVCVGNHFAQMEAVLLVATIARRVSFEPVDGFVLRYAPSVTLRPAHGVPLRARRRLGRPAGRDLG